MKNLKSIAFAVFAGAVITSCASNNNKTSESEQQVNLKDVVSDKFLMGVALNQYQTKGGDTKDQKLIRNHFNSVVAENCMKCEVIHPEEDRYDFTLADEFVEYAEKNNMHVVGHCLIWQCTDSVGWKPKFGEAPPATVTIIVSPIAREIASTIEATIPENAAGKIGRAHV